MIKNKVLENRKKAMDYSKNASRRSFDILNAPVEVKRKRSIAGSYIGIVLILVGGIFYLNKFYSISWNLIILGIATLGSNLSILNYLNKKLKNHDL